MTDQVEIYLREQFAADARRAPLGEDLAGAARAKVRRQRRRTAVVVSVALATLTIAAGGGLLATASTDKADPTRLPRPSATPSEVQARGSSTRPLTYAVGHRIHYGHQVIDAGREISFLALTDDGVVFADPDAQVWFTDGTDPVPIGRSASGRTRSQLIKSANDGSIVTWWDSADDRRDLGELVVYHTAERRIVARIRGDRGPIEGIPRLAVYDDYVYWTTSRDAHGPIARYDVSTGTQTTVPMATYEADRRARPRSLIVDNAQRDRDPLLAGSYESDYFRRVGSHLVGAHTIDVGHGVPVQPRVKNDVWVDTRTGEPLALRLPRGYRSTDAFALTQWIDDDRVALFANFDGWSEVFAKRGDIFICRLSRERCALAVDSSTARDAAGQRIGVVVAGNPFS